MKEAIDLVLDWRKAFGLKVDGNGTEEEIKLSNSLIIEEWNEFIWGKINNDKKEILDAIGDLFFVIVQRECMDRKPCFSGRGNLGYVSLSDELQRYLIEPSEKRFDAVIETLKRNISTELEDLIKEIYNSNMSKLCKDEATAIKTVEKYKQEGIETYFKPSPSDYSKYIVYRTSDNKVLKSIDFVEPNLEQFL